MNNRQVAILAVALCLVLPGLLALVFRPQGSRLDREHFEAIAVGMTRNEVKRTLGGPPRNECSIPVTVWVPHNQTLRSAELAPGTAVGRFFPNADSAEGGEELVWLGESGLIAARFGDDGRLREKYFSTVHSPGRPSALDWFRQKSAELFSSR